MKVLDVGCGSGADLKPYGEAGCEMYGIDLFPSMLERARIKFGGSADLRLCDAAHVPFQGRFFDLVLSTYTLHEIPYNKRSLVINEMEYELYYGVAENVCVWECPGCSA